jgi:putative polyhydroxyalkanoate system protein
MSEITIQRQHGKTPADARLAAEHMANELKDEFDLNYEWDGDVLRFQRPGVSGHLELDARNVTLTVHLGFFLSALKPSIEREVHKFFDENFAA